MADQLSADLASLRIPRGVGGHPRMAARRRGWLVGLIALGAAGVGGWFGWQALVARVRPLEVRVGEVRWVSPAASTVRLAASGYVVPQVISRVGAKWLGRVQTSHVREGGQVQAGAPLLELETREVAAALAASRARVVAAKARAAAAQATLAETQLQHERESRLLAAGATPRSVVEDLAARLASLRATAAAADDEASAAEAEIAQLQVRLDDAVLIAPIDGVVLRRPPDVGELIGPETGGAVEVADFRSLMVECDVPEGRLAQVTPDGPAEITLDAYPAERVRGVVDSIAPRVDRAKATVTVRVRFADGPGRALPDMAARVGFLAQALDAEAVRQPARLVVPEAAVVDGPDGRVVWRVDQGTARRTHVTLGVALPGGFEVTAGLPDGARVVLAPPSTLRDGQAIAERSGP